MNPLENTSGDTSSSGSSGADPLRSPLATDADGSDLGFDAIDSGANSKIPQGAAVLVLVALIGGGAIFAMRQFGLGSGFNYDDITIDYPIDAKEASSEEDDYEEVLTDLTNHTLPHVALEDLRPKPFELQALASDEPEFEPVSRETPEERAARKRAERDATLQREFIKLELNSVIGGSRPIARISGIAVRPGDTVNDIFTVTRISGRSVHLEAEGREYVLTMGGN